MATAYDLYENCETVISLIREEGFTKALLFKGFVEDEFCHHDHVEFIRFSRS